MATQGLQEVQGETDRGSSCTHSTAGWLDTFAAHVTPIITPGLHSKCCINNLGLSTALKALPEFHATPLIIFKGLVFQDTTSMYSFWPRGFISKLTALTHNSWSHEFAWSHILKQSQFLSTVLISVFKRPLAAAGQERTQHSHAMSGQASKHLPKSGISLPAEDAWQSVQDHLTVVSPRTESVHVL